MVQGATWSWRSCPLTVRVIGIVPVRAEEPLSLSMGVTVSRNTGSPVPARAETARHPARAGVPDNRSRVRAFRKVERRGLGGAGGCCTRLGGTAHGRIPGHAPEAAFHGFWPLSGWASDDAVTIGPAGP
ncbi:hypothetical protein Maq22A_1p37395 (plasmid) [Methylobacterium aquaticum]|uniref:Uncharacterized protein n=1 Tax=Methylobacterium aquaticum TaxID=270351 RepID=A0A0C6G1B6_9HYPH|nr:hypothetical protein Maq22A_1p37395 [Methylobacterium aquaticum]